jgi:hypothetical protein
MRTDDRRRSRILVAAVAALTLLSACTPAAPKPSATSATSTTTTTTAAAAPPPPVTPAARTVNWFDLDVGDCLAAPPPIDPTVITVALVDCATPHRAEVYLRSPMAVNTAVADVIDRTCSAGFATYTGRAVGDGTYSTTYLIDSNQNRTSANPDPSTVICLLEAAGGAPLTASARA